MNAKSRKKQREEVEKATFSAGCFWCVQHDFDQVKGVLSTRVGYTGGTTPNPTYEEVHSETSLHVEAIEIVFDPKVLHYEELLDLYWHSIDPSQENGQFCDRGACYRPTIFYHSEEQKKIAEATKIEISKKFSKIVVQILPAGVFYPAEEYHQKFYLKNPERYLIYRSSCGRDARLFELWNL
jgi:peptide-methionine (S)-S-oxide reductase